MITEGKIFAAKLRAYAEELELLYRKKYKGGWLLPPAVKMHRMISEKFDIPIYEVSRFLTYSRYCDHEWKFGACEKCPDTDHLYIPLSSKK